MGVRRQAAISHHIAILVLVRSRLPSPAIVMQVGTVGVTASLPRLSGLQMYV